MSTPEGPACDQKPQRELPRVLGMWSAASILIGSIIGSGIFTKPAAVAAALPSPGWILVCWIGAGLLALIGSLVFAELGSCFPTAGGQYTYLLEAFGKLPAFLFGWTNLLIINSASIAALAVISARFLFNVLPEAWRPEGDSHWQQTVPVLMIFALAAANSIGVRWGAAIQNLLTVLKLGALGLILVGLAFPGKGAGSSLLPFWEIRGDATSQALWAGFKGAFLAIFWAYDGWYLLSFSGGEIRNPRRNIPVGFIVGIVVVVGAYLVTNLSYLCVLGLEDMQGLREPGQVAEETAFRLYGAVGVTLLSVGILCSTFGAANGNVLTGPRLSYAMARDGLFFRRFGKLHTRYLTPLFAIVFQAAVGAIYVYCGTFDQLTDAVVFAAWIFYFLTVAGYFRLRRQHRLREGGFRAPGYPWLPGLFVLFSVWFIIYSVVDSTELAARYIAGDAEAVDGMYTIVSAILILAGIPVYWYVRRSHRG